MKTDVFKTDAYDFRLNYITPDCVEDSHILERLETALASVEKIEQ